MIVLAYGLLELLSLAVLCWALAKTLRYSAASQLAFLLTNQWGGVQIKFIIWVLYASQTSLEHFGMLAGSLICSDLNNLVDFLAGYDYTFKFRWLFPDDP